MRSQILDNPGGPFLITTTDRELTSYVAVNTAGRQIADPQVHFVDATACLSGQIVGLGLVAPQFQIAARPYVADGVLQLHFSQVTLSGRSVPGVVRRLAERITNESIRDAQWPVRIDRVRVDDGEIVVAGDRFVPP